MYNSKIMKLLFHDCIYNCSDDYQYFLPKQRYVTYYVLQVLAELHHNKPIMYKDQAYGQSGRLLKTELINLTKPRFLKDITNIWHENNKDCNLLKKNNLRWIVRHSKKHNSIIFAKLDWMCFNTVLALLRPRYIHISEHGSAERKSNGKYPYYTIKISQEGLLLYQAWQELRAGKLKEETEEEVVEDGST